MKKLTLERYLNSIDFDAIKQICKPLEDYFGLTSFVYRKNYYDGTEINLSNQPNWVEHFYSNHALIKQSTFDKHPDTYQSGFVLWSQLQGHQDILQQARQFNIDHGITIVKKTVEGVELYYFGTRSDRPDVVNHYLNNIDLLERFILFFKNQAACIIAHAESNKLKIISDKYEKIEVISTDLLAIKPSFTRMEFIKSTELKRYHLDGEFQGIELGLREMEVISCLLRGMTSEETGKSLFLSPRTVEDYLGQIRVKFSVSSKSKLIQKLLAADFKSYIPQD